MDKDGLNLHQVAEQCCLSQQVILEHITNGKLMASKNTEGQYIIKKEDLFDFMHQQGLNPLASYLPKSKKILVVDDESTVLSMLDKMLSKDGYLIEIASNGFQARTKIVEFEPGLVVLDLFMPETDGFEVCRQIKKSPDTKDIKVLAITGKGDEDTRRIIIKLGADSFLTKPLDRKSLLENVKLILNSDD